MPRLLIADGAALWRRVEDSALRREDVVISLARGSGEAIQRARTERFDAVLAAEGSQVHAELTASATGTPVLAWPPEGDLAADMAPTLGLPLRRLQRLRVRWWVEVALPTSFRARSRDASLEGLFLVDAPELPIGTRLTAALRAPAKRQRARVRLEVVRSERPSHGSYRLGGLAVRLRPEEARDAAQLERWLTEEAAKVK